MAQAARDLDLHENVLGKWIREVASDPQHAFPGHGLMKPKQQEIDRLREKVVNLAHNASLHSCEKSAPSKSGIRHLETGRISCGGLQLLEDTKTGFMALSGLASGRRISSGEA